MIKQSRPIILLTRPALQSARFAAELASDGLDAEVLISSLFRLRFLPCFAPQPKPLAVIFTSESGVAGAVAAGLVQQGQPAYCVGTRTAQAAAQAGYVAHDAQGDWRDLAAMVQARCPRAVLGLFCAADAPAHLETALKNAGYTVQRLPVYTQDVIDLTAQARELLAATNPIILPVFSPRSAQVLSHQVQGARAPLWLAAISDASLAAFDAPYVNKIVADRPNAAAMRDATRKLLHAAQQKRPNP